MGEVFTTLSKIGAISQTTCEQLKKAIGLRNIAVHNYETINWEIVYTFANNPRMIFVDFHRKSVCTLHCKIPSRSNCSTRNIQPMQCLRSQNQASTLQYQDTKITHRHIASLIEQ